MFSRFKNFAAGVLLGCAPGIALAGIPEPMEVTCPIGGETFEITTTASCSQGGFGYTMSFRTLTSCDFITRLPQCPGNGLPLYRDFTDDELARIEALMGEPAYRQARDVSRYYLARELGDEEVEPFWLLANGFWYGSENTYDDPIYQDAFFPLAEAEAAKGGDDQFYVHALTAYAYAGAGRPEEAKALLAKAEDGPEDLRLYVEAVRRCLPDAAVEGCAPDDPVKGSGMWAK